MVKAAGTGGKLRRRRRCGESCGLAAKTSCTLSNARGRLRARDQAHPKVVALVPAVGPLALTALRAAGARGLAAGEWLYGMDDVRRRENLQSVGAGVDRLLKRKLGLLE